MAAFKQIGQKIGIDKDQELLDAARAGKCDVIEKLLKKSTSGSSLIPSFLKSVNINCADRDKETPLHLAALNGHVGVVEILLRENATVNAIDNRGCSPLHLASWKGNSELCRILLTNQNAQVQVNIQNGDGETPLHSAAQYGSTATVSVLLEHHADPTIRNLKDESPLDLAARYGRTEVVQCLLKKYPELVHETIVIHSPLHLAAACGHKQIVEMLLKNGFDINTKTEHGTALHLAALYCKPEIVKILLDNGVNYNEVDKDGMTVLQILKQHEKTQSSYTDVINIIVEHISKITKEKKASESAESSDVNVYDSLVDQRPRPVPKPRLSLEGKSLLTKSEKQLSVTYASIDKSLCEKLVHSEAESDTVFTEDDPPPVPPRQSSFDLEGDTSPVHRTIEEVEKERDSAVLDNIKPFQPPFTVVSTVPELSQQITTITSKTPPPHSSPRPSPHKTTQSISPPLPPKVRTNRQIVSMYDVPNLPQSMSHKSSPVMSSVQNLHSVLPPPVPCEQSHQQQAMGYFDMNSPASSPRTQAKRPIKPPRIKKAGSPIPVRSTMTQSRIEESPQLTGDSNQEKSVGRLRTQSENVVPSGPSDVDDSGDTPETYTNVTISKTDPKNTEYEVMSEIKSPITSYNSVLDTYQIAATVSRNNEIKTEEVTTENTNIQDTYQMISDVSRTKNNETKTVKPKNTERKTQDTYQITSDVSRPKNDETKTTEPKNKETQDTYQIASDLSRPKSNEPQTQEESKNASEPQDVVYRNVHSIDVEYENAQSVEICRTSTGFSPVTEVLPKRDSKTLPESAEYDTIFNVRHSEHGAKDDSIPESDSLGNIPEIKTSKHSSSYDTKSDIPVIKTESSASKSTIPNTLLDSNMESVTESVSDVAESVIPVTTSVSDVTDSVIPVTKSVGADSEVVSPVMVSVKDNCDTDICDNKVSGDTNSVHDKTEKTERLSNGVSENTTYTAEGNDGKLPKPPSLEFSKKRVKETNIPLTPTGYSQPPTPDFPPPSPHTAMIGIEEKMAVIDNKRSSKDMETITEASLLKDDSGQGQPVIRISNGNIQGQEETQKDEEPEEPVVMRRSILRSSTSSLDDIVVDDRLGPFAGLYRGSVIGGPRTVISQITENVSQRNSWTAGHKSFPASSGMTFDPVREEENSMAATTTSKHNSVSVKTKGEEGGVDDDEEWAKIADIVSSFGGDIGVYADLPSFEAEIKMLNRDIMASFGGGIARESVFMREMEPTFMKKLVESINKYPGKIQSVGEWLDDIGLGQYENTLVANGFDHTDFLFLALLVKPFQFMGYAFTCPLSVNADPPKGEKIMEDHDLERIGITVAEHRKQILNSAKSLPQIKPIDPNNPPASVADWLHSLHLSDKMETFMHKQFDTMERVMQLWEFELTSVLDISAIGHRKRILASLQNRKKPERQFPSLKKRTKEMAEEQAEPFQGISLYKDYTKVKPLASSSEEETKVPQNSLPRNDSSEDEDVFRKDQGKALRDSSIHLRPPHQANIAAPIKQWRHRPEMLIKGCCNYSSQYLGSTLVRELSGTESTIEGITKLKKSADVIAKIPTILLSISYKGVKFIDAKSKKVICDHEIGNIFCACQDAHSMNFFAYITRDNQTAKHYCHVFNCRTADLAREIIMTLGEAFEVAYQMALKDKALVEAEEFERKLSQSDTDDSTSISSSKASINTV